MFARSSAQAAQIHHHRHVGVKACCMHNDLLRNKGIKQTHQRPAKGIAKTRGSVVEDDKE